MQNIFNLIRNYILETLAKTTIPATQAEMIASQVMDLDIERSQSILNTVTSLRSNELNYAQAIECWLQTSQRIGHDLVGMLELEADHIAHIEFGEILNRRWRVDPSHSERE